MGVVVSVNPLQVRPGFTGSDRSFVLIASEMITDPDADFVKGELVICTPIRGGYWYVRPTSPGGNAGYSGEGGGTDTDTGTGGVEVDPGLLEKSASDRIVSRAKALVGKLPEGGTAWSNYMSPVSGYDPWCAFFVKALYKEMQVPGWSSWGGAVASIYNSASSSEIVSNPQDFPGCVIVKLAAGVDSSGNAIFSAGDHTCIFIDGNRTRGTSVGGNESNNVGLRNGAWNTRGYKEIAFIVPSGLKQDESATDVTDGGI